MTAPLSVADVLDRAADLIEPEGKWTQGAYGRDATGCEVIGVENAVCFCAMGAMYKARGDIGAFEHDPDLVRPLAALIERTCDAAIDDWNDASERTQTEVVSALREAAALARKEQGA
ncbi:MAG: DUF6197 family protein [Polynucleobacter sp.]